MAVLKPPAPSAVAIAAFFLGLGEANPCLSGVQPSLVSLPKDYPTLKLLLPIKVWLALKLFGRSPPPPPPVIIKASLIRPTYHSQMMQSFPSAMKPARYV